MDMTFKGMAGTMGNKPWTVSDTTITRGTSIYQISDIVDLKNKPAKSRFSNGIFLLTFKGGKTLILPYSFNQTEEAAQAFQHLCNHSGNNEKAQSTIEYEKLRRGEEIRKRCNVCGYVMCYNYEDYAKNEELKKSVARDRTLGALSALSVSILQSEVTSGNADRKESQIRDFNRCPKCNSTDLTEITADEFRNTQASDNSAGSVADEIRKFKELLDMGAISQEEYDAKKKQLLGL